MKTCLDLFAGLGGFSQAFEESDGWEVVTVEIEERFNPDICADVIELRPGDLPNAEVVLASPPCDRFSMMNAGKYWDGGGTPDHPETRNRIALTFHAIGLIRAIDPAHWFLENPRAMLRTVLGKPEGTVTYCQYGKNSQKPTDLWGDHPDGFEYRSCSRGDPCHEEAPRGSEKGTQNWEVASEERARVPRELSESILRAVEGRSEQKSLTEVEYVEG